MACLDESITPKGLLIRSARKVLRRERLDKIISRAAFHPPRPTYKFVDAKNMDDTNIYIMKHPEVAATLRSKGYRARGDFVQVDGHGKVPYIYIVPNGYNLSDCDQVILHSHGTSIDLGIAINICFRILNKVFDQNTSRIGVVLWDYPGYGISTSRTPSESGMVKGIMAVYSQVVNVHKVRSSRIIAIGQSIGTVATTYLASRWGDSPISKVILISPIASAYHVFSNSTPLLSKESLDPIGALSNINLLQTEGCPWPVIVLHGENDTFVPIEHSRAIINILQQQSKEEVAVSPKEVARRDLQHKIYLTSNASIDSMSHSDASLNQSGAHQTKESLTVPAMLSTSRVFSGTSNEVLLRDRSILIPIPGVGHNDITDSSVLYDELRGLLGTIKHAGRRKNGIPSI